MRMLLVAPERAGVNWSAEVELLGTVLHAVPLTGHVSSERLTRATSGERFTILHVVADGNDEGVALSDGLLVKERLAQIARHVRADLVFLNACRSAALGQYLACQGVPAVICYTVPVLDADALRMASYFYEELVALGLDYRRAFEKVSPCDGSLAWFAGAGYVDKAVEPLVTMVGFLQQEMVIMRRTMVRGMVAMGVVNLLAVGMLLSVALPGVQGQGESPLATVPVDSPLIGNGGPDPPAATPHPIRKPKDEDDPPTVTAWPTETSTVTPTATHTLTSTATRTPTPWPTVALPTLTPDWLATIAAGCPWATPGPSYWRSTQTDSPSSKLDEGLSVVLDRGQES
jgi:hypothetical protein